MADLPTQRRGPLGSPRVPGRARIGALEQCDPFREDRHGRILEARMGHAVLGAREARRGIARAIVRITRRKEDRLRRFAPFGARRTAAYRLGRGAPIAGDLAVLPGVSLHDPRFPSGDTRPSTPFPLVADKPSYHRTSVV